MHGSMEDDCGLAQDDCGSVMVDSIVDDCGLVVFNCLAVDDWGLLLDGCT